MTHDDDDALFQIINNNRKKNLVGSGVDFKLQLVFDALTALKDWLRRQYLKSYAPSSLMVTRWNVWTSFATLET